jgi:hypothetical protein
MATNVEIPTQPGGPFSERVTLQDVTYTLNFRWNTVAQVWTVDFYDEAGTSAILRGVVLVTGCDLLEQFAYLTLGARLILTVMTIGPGVSPDDVPGFNDLGVDGHLYATMPVTAA